MKSGSGFDSAAPSGLKAPLGIDPIMDFDFANHIVESVGQSLLVIGERLALKLF